MFSNAGYLRHREKMARRSRAKSEGEREIGELPPVVDAARRESCRFDLERFCRTYLAEQFPLPFGHLHKKLIKALQDAILKGGRIAMALPRGFGKTTLARAAALWAVAYGHHRYVVVIAATAPAAKKILRSIKILIETSRFLNEDFPEITYPIQKLQGITQRAPGQLYHGNPTRLCWKGDAITLAEIPGSSSAGCTIETVGIGGAIRGRQQQLATGEILRPSLVLIDDPQTRASAKSNEQTADRLTILRDDVLGLAGPGLEVAVVCACTVIYRGDFADQLLDTDKNPDWHSTREGIISQLPGEHPEARKLLDDFAELLRAELRQGHKHHPAATALWKEHQAILEAGCVASWPDRFDAKVEVSAIQHACTLWVLNPVGFFAEYMNDPLGDAASIVDLDAAGLAKAVGTFSRGLVPDAVTHLTAFIDVQERALFWLVAGWRPDLTGWVIDYGVWPEQRKSYFTLSTLTGTIGRSYPGRSNDRAMLDAIADLETRILDRGFAREDGTTQRVEVCLIDTGYRGDVIYQSCRDSKFRPRLQPAKGFSIGPTKKPMTEWRRVPGDRVGPGWLFSRPGKRIARSLHIDTYHWKTTAAIALAKGANENGSITLPTGNNALLIDHCMAEKSDELSSGQRTVYAWSMRPGETENHWWDCLVGTMAGASWRGCNAALPDLPAAESKAAQTKPKKRKKVSYLET